MTRRRVWAVVVAAFVAGGALAFAVVSVQDDGAPPVTAGPARPSASRVPETRTELIEAWVTELRRAGRELPDDWETLTTGEIRTRYLHQRLVNAPSADELDPGINGFADE